MLEVRREVAEVVVERAGGAGDVGEQEAVALLHADAVEARGEPKFSISSVWGADLRLPSKP